jgi:S-layer homology domain
MNQKIIRTSIKSIALFFTLLSMNILASEARVSALPTTTLNSVPTKTQIAQANLNDYAGSWAEPFIKVLIEKNIIVGYPDGTFKPDQPVTRAEFAALLNKAFELQPIRESRAFRDVPTKYWAAEVIDKAYRSGFLAGYPNGTFGPNRNIIRIESLVSLANGSKLQPDGSPDRVDELFADAAQVPSYGRNALLAATQKCVSVSVSYPVNKNYDPNRIGTRADVAASIHQVLVAAGRLPALAADNPAQKYVVNCAAAVPVAKISEQDLLNRTSVGTYRRSQQQPFVNQLMHLWVELPLPVHLGQIGETYLWVLAIRTIYPQPSYLQEIEIAQYMVLVSA